MEYLKKDGVNAAGIARLNRTALPIDMEKNLDRGECDHRVSKDSLTV